MKKEDFSINLFAKKLLSYSIIIIIYSVIVVILVTERMDDWLSLTMLFTFWLFLTLFGIFDTLSQPIVQLLGNQLTSQSYKKKALCSVDLTQPVYYSIYREKGRFTDSFIIISNDPFVRYSNQKTLADDFYYEGYLKDKKKSLFDTRAVYDKEKQIRMPYTKSVANHFSLEKWIEVKTIYPWDTSYPS